jgi:A/G-specific adenine glycosylase
MVIFCQDGKKGKFIYLRKREENDVWKNLYDFPLIEANQELDEEKLLSSSEWRKTIQNGKSELIHKSPLYKHILTHQIIFARFYIFRETGKPVTKLPYLLVSLGEINLYPLPRLVEQFLQKTMIVF